MLLSTLSYTAEAGWSKVIEDSADGAQTLVIAFGAPRFGDDPRPFSALRDRLPNAHIVGCSTAGEILGSKVLDDTIVAAIVRFERTRLCTAVAEVRKPSDSRTAGNSLGRTLAAPDLRGVLL